MKKSKYIIISCVLQNTTGLKEVENNNYESNDANIEASESEEHYAKNLSLNGLKIPIYVKFFGKMDLLLYSLTLALYTFDPDRSLQLLV